MITQWSCRSILFDWGNTLMYDIKEYAGPMKAWPRVAVVPQAAELLAALRPGRILCLATNAEDSTEMDIRQALQRADLSQWLERIYCYKTIGFKKPSPAFFIHILADLQVDPEQVIMVGDDYEVDILGASRCGLRAIWFNENRDENRSSQRIRTIFHLGDLPAVVQSWD